MSAQPNDGGAAFPCATGTFDPPQIGMSLRDWFASHVPPLPERTSDNHVVALVGGPLPPAFDHLARAIYWAKADAAYRYMQADAMIAARADLLAVLDGEPK